MKKTIIIAILFFAGKMQAEITLMCIQDCEQERHSERSEESAGKQNLFVSEKDISEQILRYAQDDTTNQLTNSRDPVVAWLVSFPAGMLGLHRVYLGTDAKTVLLYIATAGGFLGIVPMMDWILLLRAIQNGDVSRYVNNKRFIMWL